MTCSEGSDHDAHCSGTTRVQDLGIKIWKRLAAFAALRDRAYVDGKVEQFACVQYHKGLNEGGHSESAAHGRIRQPGTRPREGSHRPAHGPVVDARPTGSYKG